MLTENIKEYNPQKDKNNLIHRIIETNKELKVKIKIKTMSNITPIPPWFDITKNIETKFLDEQTKNIPEQIIRAQYIMLENTRYRNYKKLFTDGSKINNDSTSAAIYIQDNNITTIWKLPNNTEIIEAELFAIKQGLKYIQNNKLSKSVIFTDSKSALQLISNPKPKNSKSMTFEIQELIYTMVNQNQIIMLQWIPSHKNIKGNEIVDQAAKKAHKIRYPITIHEDTKKQIKQMKKKTDYKQQTDDNTNTIQQTNPNITQTYAKILTQTNNITPAQKTPTKQKNNTNRVENTPTQSTKSKQKNSQEKTKEQTHTKEQNIKDKKLTESPITWSLPTPLNKTPTIKEKKKKEEEEEQKNKEEKPSFVEITKGIFKLITNITEKFKSDKTIIEIITEIITEVAPILKQISVWFND